MAAITAAMVKELRESTGAGMMDCKKALSETDGDMEKAVEFLRKKGLATADKKAGRIAAEGIVSTMVSADGKTAAIIEVNSETDFVAKNAVFQEYVKGLATQILNNDYADLAAFLAAKSEIDSSATVEEYHKSMVAKIGENLTIRRFEKVSGDVLVPYIHMGGKIGVLVEAECDSVNDSIKEAMKNLAMQVAAMNPTYLKSEDMSEEALSKEKEVVIDSSINDPATLPKPLLTALFDEVISSKALSDEDIKAYEENKNNKFLFNFISGEGKNTLAENAMKKKDEYLQNKIFTGLVDGRISKHLKEICLLDQAYVKAENKETVKQYIDSVAKVNGCKFVLKKYVRFETGEGLEKKSENFAEEVAKQMGM